MKEKILVPPITKKEKTMELIQNPKEKILKPPRTTKLLRTMEKIPALPKNLKEKILVLLRTLNYPPIPLSALPKVVSP
jgi:hypothetical protein